MVEDRLEMTEDQLFPDENIVLYWFLKKSNDFLTVILHFVAIMN
jgi:hypothetical protein